MVDKQKTTKIQIIAILILILVLSITGTTYAYFAISSSNNTTITGDAATVNLTLDVTKIFPTTNSTNTGVLVPQLSTSGSASSPLSNALKNGCIDSNKNIVCQVYKINIKNIGGSVAQLVDGNIYFYSNPSLTQDATTTIPNLKWRIITSADQTNPSSSVLGANPDRVAGASRDNNIVSNLTMTNGSNHDYYIIVWLNETKEIQPIDAGKTFYGKVEFNASNGSGVTATFGDYNPAINNN